MMNSVSPACPSPGLPLPFVPAAPDNAADGPAAFAKALGRAAQAQDNPADKPHDHTVRDDNEPGTRGAARRVAKGKRPAHTHTTQPRDAAATPATPATPARPATPGADEGLPDVQANAAQQAQDSTHSGPATRALLDIASLMFGLAQAASGAARTGETGGTAEATEAAQAAQGSTSDTTAALSGRATAQQHDGKAAVHAQAARTQRQDAVFAASQGLESRASPPGEAVAAAAVVQGLGLTRQLFDTTVGSPLTPAPGALPPVLSTTPISPPAAVFQTELAAALGTPEFASALGLHVSVLIRDGMLQAQLHLNPADMGPIAVHIRLDGDNAQVDFSALQALTRQALEDAVPALASALRESGLTLSGGGVFEHARQPQGEQRGSRDDRAALPSSDAAEVVPTHAAIARALRARGMVDLYA